MDLATPSYVIEGMSTTLSVNTTRVFQNGTGAPTPPYWGSVTTKLLAITMVIFMVCATFGNAMVILVISRHRGMRTRTNMFLCNLAIADFLTAVLLMPVALVTVIKGDWVFSEVFCQINGFTMPLFFVASIHTLMYISIHKYITITRPFSRSMTRRRILLMIAAAWFWATLTGYLTVHGLNTVLYKPFTTQCGPRYPTTIRAYFHPLYIGLTCYLIPFVIMSFCYARIFREMREHSDRMEANSNLEKEMLFRQQRRITITLFVVLAVFIISWTPYVLYSFYVSALKEKSDVPSALNAVCYWFGYMNSACNPIIYALRSKAFREGYKELWCRKVSGPISEDAVADSFYVRLIQKIFPTEPQTDQTSAFQRLQVFIQNSLRLRGPQLYTSSSGTLLTDSGIGSRKVSAGSMAHFLVRPLSRRISTSSLPESFRYCTASLPKAYRHRHITFHEPLKKANRNSDTNGAPDHRKLYNEEEIGLIANGEDRSRLTIQMSPYQKTEADLSPVLSEGTSSALGTTTDDNVFITTADVVKSDLRTPSPQAPVIQVIEPEPDDNEQKPTDLDFKRRFLANKSASVSDPKFDESSDDAPARSSSESNLQKISPPGFLKSLLRGFQSKSRSRERMRIRSNASSSSERKSSLKEESSDAHSPPVKHKKMSLTVPTWKSILRSLSEDSRNAGGGHSSGEMHKAASDSLYIHESGHLKQTGRKWWKRWKDTGKLSASDDVRLTNNLCIEDDREVSVGTITQSDDEKMRLQRTWSDKPQLQRYPSVEQLDKHKRSLSFTPVRKKRRRRKTRPRDSSRKEPRIEPESRSLPFVPSDTEVDTGASQRKERRELTPRQRSWSDPCITFHILERKVSVWRTTRSKSRRRREAKNTPAESTIVNVC